MTSCKVKIHPSLVTRAMCPAPWIQPYTYEVDSDGPLLQGRRGFHIQFSPFTNHDLKTQKLLKFLVPFLRPDPPYRQRLYVTYHGSHKDWIGKKIIGYHLFGLDRNNPSFFPGASNVSIVYAVDGWQLLTLSLLGRVHLAKQTSVVSQCISNKGPFTNGAIHSFRVVFYPRDLRIYDRNSEALSCECEGYYQGCFLPTT